MNCTQLCSWSETPFASPSPSAARTESATQLRFSRKKSNSSSTTFSTVPARSPRLASTAAPTRLRISWSQRESTAWYRPGFEPKWCWIVNGRTPHARESSRTETPR